MSIDSLCSKAVCGLGSEYVVIGLNVDVVENTGGGNVGCDEYTVSGRTLRAVTGDRTHSEVLFAYTLGNEGGGAAAVTVCSPLAAESEHCFALLVGAEANRIVCAAAVVHTDNERTVSLNANHRARCIVRSALFGCVNQLSVVDNHTEGNSYRVQKRAVSEILVNVSLVIRLDVAGHVSISIAEDVENRGGRTENFAAGSHVFVRVTDPLSVVDENSGRVGAVVEVGVHTAYDVVSKSILVILSHLGKLLMRPVSLIFQVLIDLIITGNDGYVGI